MRKWRENEEVERNSLFTFPPFLFLSSLSIHFLYQKFSYFVGQAITKSGSDDGNMKCKLFLVGVNWKDDRNLQIGEVPS